MAQRPALAVEPGLGWPRSRHRRAPGTGEGDRSLGLGTAASPSPVRQPQAAEPGGNRVLPWRWQITATLLGRARMRRCLAPQSCSPGLCRALQGSGTDPSRSQPCNPKGFAALRALLPGSLGTVRWSSSNQQHRSFTAAFACGSAAGARSPEQTIQGKPLVPCGHDPRGPRGDDSLSTNQGPKPDWGQVSKVGCSRGSRPHDWTNKERENKAASSLKRGT